MPAPVPASENDNMDLWSDEFTRLQKSDRPENGQPEFQGPTDEEDDLEDENEPEEVVAPAPAPVVEEPRTTTFEGGSSLTVEKTASRGWKATLRTGTSAPPEVFYGATKDELLINVGKAKVNATKKIQEQNRTIKLGTGRETAAAPAPRVAAAPRPLTAEENFALKTKFEANPDEAMSEWLMKRTGGVSLEDLLDKAQKGEKASDEIIIGDNAREFRERHPEYYPAADNFSAMVAWLARHKIGRTLTAENQGEMVTALVRADQWTADNLEEAYEDLRESGLLESRPVAPKPEEPAPPAPTAPVAPAAAAPTSEPRTTRPRQPRAGLGIREREVSAPTPPVAEAKPLSDSDFNKLSDQEIKDLLSLAQSQYLARPR